MRSAQTRTGPKPKDRCPHETPGETVGAHEGRVDHAHPGQGAPGATWRGRKDPPQPQETANPRASRPGGESIPFPGAPGLQSQETLGASPASLAEQVFSLGGSTRARLLPWAERGVPSWPSCLYPRFPRGPSIHPGPAGRSVQGPSSEARAAWLSPWGWAQRGACKEPRREQAPAQQSQK